MTSLLLASASPARAATLRAAGIDPLIEVSHVDEDAALAAHGPLSVAASVQVLAEAKARAVAAARPQVDLILGCDSMFELDGVALGKPGTAQVAARRWRDMRGRTGTLHTGHFLIASSGATRAGGARTEVTFADVTDAEIDAYVATGEPLGVAGGFTIDGLGGAFITGVAGDHHAVVGLSLPLLRAMVRDLGHSWPSLWNRAGAQ